MQYRSFYAMNYPMQTELVNIFYYDLFLVLPYVEVSLKTTRVFIFIHVQWPCREFVATGLQEQHQWFRTRWWFRFRTKWWFCIASSDNWTCCWTLAFVSSDFGCTQKVFNRFKNGTSIFVIFFLIIDMMLFKIYWDNYS